MPTASNIRVLCVDDHRIVLDGISFMLNKQRDMEVVGRATTGEQAVALYNQHRPDVTLMDLQLPAMSGLQAIRVIRRDHPAARIIVLTMYQGDEDIYRALEAGAATYVLKDALSSELVRVVRDVYRGGRPVSPNVAAALATRHASPALTAREIEVVQFIAKGMRNKDIAASLGISEETVKVHVKNILAKLNVSDRAAVTAVALRRGIIHLN